MRFKLDLLPDVDLRATTTDAGRVYHTPVGDLPSVTTVIGRHYPSDWLDDWRDRIGKDNADHITRRAQTRGTMVHSIMEKFLLNEEDYLKGVMPMDRMSVRKLTPVMEKNIDLVYGIEYPLYNKWLNTAGRTDGLVRWNGRNSVLDFKNVAKPKKEEDVFGYYVQTTCYAMMASMLTGTQFDQVVVAVMVDDEKPQLFVRDRDDFVAEVLRVFVEERK